MNGNAPSQELATSIAEEVLRIIYGDDLTGCAVSLDTITAVIHGAMQHPSSEEQELIALYEKLVEALHGLSTPPAVNTVMEPDELRTLLGNRLDAIHALTTKTLQTTARLRVQDEV